jgi:hypothetical protein
LAPAVDEYHHAHRDSDQAGDRQAHEDSYNQNGADNRFITHPTILNQANAIRKPRFPESGSLVYALPLG